MGAGKNTDVDPHGNCRRGRALRWLTWSATRAEMFVRPGTKVHIRGCATEMPPFCVMVAEKGQSFNVTGANPPVPIGTPIGVLGVSSGHGLCGGGAIVLKNITWYRIKGVCN